jgi:hypothetical protein
MQHMHACTYMRTTNTYVHEIHESILYAYVSRHRYAQIRECTSYGMHIHMADNLYNVQYEYVHLAAMKYNSSCTWY